eukprot:15338174-Ditylum_brightwellii.AAC.1
MVCLPAITPMPQDQPSSLIITHTSNEVWKWRALHVQTFLRFASKACHPNSSNEGPATKLLCFGFKCTSTFNTSTHKFGNAVRTAAGIKMCRQAMKDPHLCNVLGCTNKEWCHCHDGSKLFGSNYAESTPSAWSKNFLAAKFTCAFAQH